VRDIALLPRGAQGNFPDQAVAVPHTQRLLEEAAHLLPVCRRRAGGSGEGEFGVTAVKYNVKPTTRCDDEVGRFLRGKNRPEGDASEADWGGVVGRAAGGHATGILPLPLHDVTALASRVMSE
jgi:hypothetical protein